MVYYCFVCYNGSKSFCIKRVLYNFEQNVFYNCPPGIVQDDYVSKQEAQAFKCNCVICHFEAQFLLYFMEKTELQQIPSLQELYF